MGHNKTLVIVKSIAAGKDEYNYESFLPGDVVEHLRWDTKPGSITSAPFSRGKSGLQHELKKLQSSEDKLMVRVRRGPHRVEVRASVVAEESMFSKHYTIAEADNPNRIVTLMDATEEECFALQDQTRKRVEAQTKSALQKSELKDCTLQYRWVEKMQQFLSGPSSNTVFSLLLMPFQPNQLVTEYNCVEETSARAMAWLSAAQRSGVPVHFLNIQTEPILRQGASSTYFGGSTAQEAPEIVANSGNYALHDWRAADIEIIRAVRLWYSPAVAEVPIELMPAQGETRLGVVITRTEEGFCFVQSVEPRTPADRSGLGQMFRAACECQKKLVISRVAGRKITPWMVSSTGKIRSLDTHSISELFIQYREARRPVQLSVIIWDDALLLNYYSCNPHLARRNTGSGSGRTSPNKRQPGKKYEAHEPTDSDSEDGIGASSATRSSGSYSSGQKVYEGDTNGQNTLQEDSDAQTEKNDDFSFSF